MTLKMRRERRFVRNYLLARCTANFIQVGCGLFTTLPHRVVARDWFARTCIASNGLGIPPLSTRHVRATTTATAGGSRSNRRKRALHSRCRSDVVSWANLVHDRATWWQTRVLCASPTIHRCYLYYKRCTPFGTECFISKVGAIQCNQNSVIFCGCNKKISSPSVFTKKTSL